MLMGVYSPDCGVNDKLRRRTIEATKRKSLWEWTWGSIIRRGLSWIVKLKWDFISWNRLYYLFILFHLVFGYCSICWLQQSLYVVWNFSFLNCLFHQPSNLQYSSLKMQIGKILSQLSQLLLVPSPIPQLSGKLLMVCWNCWCCLSQSSSCIFQGRKSVWGLGNWEPYQHHHFLVVTTDIPDIMSSIIVNISGYC
jgi:hypothetical protein